MDDDKKLLSKATYQVTDSTNQKPSYDVRERQYDLIFKWRIENFSLRKGRLESPHFYYKSSEWCVEIFLRDMCSSRSQIKIGFRQLTDQKIEANWTLALVNFEGSLHNLGQLNDVVNNGKSSEACTWILKYDGIFNVSSNVPNDILAIVGRIESLEISTRKKMNLNQDSILSKKFVSQFVVVKDKVFDITNVDIRPYNPGHIKNYVEPIWSEKILNIKLHKEGNRKLIVTLEDPIITPIPSKYFVYLAKTGGKYVKLEEDQFKSNNFNYVFYFNFDSDPVEFNLCFRGRYYYYKILNSMVDNLACNSNQNALLRQTPGTSKKSSEIGTEPRSTILNEFQHTQSPEADTPSTISQDLRSMYEEGFLSDFDLRVHDQSSSIHLTFPVYKTFRVHKSILGARSSVFRTMFTADMKEKESNHVDIPDVDADTIQNMLKFVYWDEVDENMQWESACCLYSAADKYALESLKQRCSTHLKTNLSATSVIGVLLLSDTHQDQTLKTTALDFISSHDKEVIGTEKWRKFTEEHGPLSLEILQQLYIKKMAV